jgi:hypothetical protein
MMKPACAFLQLFIVKAPKASTGPSEVSTENCLDCIWDSGLPTSDAMSLGGWLLTFHRTVVPSSLQGQLFLEDEGALALQNIRNPSQQHSIIFQDTRLHSSTAVRTSNLTLYLSILSLFTAKGTLTIKHWHNNIVLLSRGAV